MHRKIEITLVILILGCTTPLVASDHTGIYALIHQVKIKNAKTPQATVEIQGIFALAKGRRSYHPPQHGYLHYRLRKGKENICRNEWNDLKSVAGKGKFVAFGHRYGFKAGRRTVGEVGRVRRPNEKPINPDAYPINFGVRIVRRSRYFHTIQSLAYYAAPATPTEGAKVVPGPVKLVANKVLPVAKNVSVRYFFEITTIDGKKLSSKSVKAGKKQAAWIPDLKIEPGQKYTWRVWTIRKIKKSGSFKLERGAVATATFHGKKAATK